MKSTLLELKGVVRAFGGLLALNDVSLEMSSDEIVAVIGPNGAGKTTLFNVICGNLPHTSGETWFKNRRLNGLSPHKISLLGIARTFQHALLYENMCTMENVMVGCDRWGAGGLISSACRFPGARKGEQAIRERAMSELSLVGLTEKAQALPSTLSVKERKLLEIARAMATEPQLLLLDEPASGLNTEEVEALCELIYKIRDKGVSVLLVEHRMELVMNIAQRVVVLNYGQKIAEGTPSEIQDDQQVIGAYLGDTYERE